MVLAAFPIATQLYGLQGWCPSPVILIHFPVYSSDMVLYVVLPCSSALERAWGGPLVPDTVTRSSASGFLGVAAAVLVRLSSLAGPQPLPPQAFRDRDWSRCYGLG